MVIIAQAVFGHFRAQLLQVTPWLVLKSFFLISHTTSMGEACLDTDGDVVLPIRVQARMHCEVLLAVVHSLVKAGIISRILSFLSIHGTTDESFSAISRLALSALCLSAPGEGFA